MLVWGTNFKLASHSGVPRWPFRVETRGSSALVWQGKASGDTKAACWHQADLPSLTTRGRCEGLEAEVVNSVESLPQPAACVSQSLGGPPERQPLQVSTRLKEQDGSRCG